MLIDAGINPEWLWEEILNVEDPEMFADNEVGRAIEKVFNRNLRRKVKFFDEEKIGVLSEQEEEMTFKRREAARLRRMADRLQRGENEETEENEDQ